MKYLQLSAFIFIGIFLSAQQKTEIINAENGKLLVSDLKEGTKDYIVYFTDSTKQKRSNGDLWRRITKFKKMNGKDVIEFTWQAYVNGKLYSETKNISDRKTLAPVFHKTVFKKIGDERYDKWEGVEAYDFTSKKMVPTDSIANNNAKKLGEKTISIPIINWEQDLETYPLLPIKKVGQVFDIAFFDPNEKETKYHRYEVIGKENLKLNEETAVPCWILMNNEGKKDSYSKFWLSEKTKEVLKMEELFRGRYRFKVLQY